MEQLLFPPLSESDLKEFVPTNHESQKPQTRTHMSVWNLFSTLFTALLGTMAETPEQHTLSVEGTVPIFELRTSGI
jgi:hypothetical protein